MTKNNKKFRVRVRKESYPGRGKTNSTTRLFSSKGFRDMCYFFRRVYKNTAHGAPTDSVGPISLVALARRKKTDLEKDCGWSSPGYRGGSHRP